jgi:hypothetical protein
VTTTRPHPMTGPHLVEGTAVTGERSESRSDGDSRPNEGVRLGGGPGGRPLKRPEAPVLFVKSVAPAGSHSGGCHGWLGCCAVSAFH